MLRVLHGRKVPRPWACHPVHPRRRGGGFGTNSSEGSEASPSRLVLAERCARIVRRLPPDGYAGGEDSACPLQRGACVRAEAWPRPTHTLFRSEVRRVGKECVMKCISRWS